MTPKQPTIACVVGTRPEAVKMAPVILRLGRDPRVAVRVINTGQHRELLHQALGDFGIKPDLDLAIMQPNQKLAELTGRALVALSSTFESDRPDLVLAQGDTTTVLCAALACYYHRISFGHVEAGLRTGNPYFPFPEEKNRVLAGHLAELHFAPTTTSRDNLLREGILDASIHVTGNTVIDALLLTASRDIPLPLKPATPRFILVTAHRRENFGAPLEEICRALRTLVDGHKDLCVVYPVHPNPNVREATGKLLGGHERIHLIEPAGYPQFVALMKQAHIIVTDSGGVQEEGPSLGKPVLVLRDETERPEAVAAGTVRLIGPHYQPIVDAVERLLADPAEYARFSRAVNPYGDGWASERIARILLEKFGLDPGPIPAEMSAAWPP